MTAIFRFGSFTSHSGLMLPYKWDFDAWTDEALDELARFLRWKLPFGEVFAVPSDETPPRNPAGPRLARALNAMPFESDHPPLIVDDVMTTGRSMERFRERIAREHSDVGLPMGFVMLSRMPEDLVPSWIFPLMVTPYWVQS
jgi:hypothetical protein